MATSDEAKAKISEVNSVLEGFPDFDSPDWSKWYYSYLLDSYVINVADAIQSAVMDKKNCVILSLRYDNCLISEDFEHFGKFVTLARHGKEKLDKLFPKVKVSPLQYGGLMKNEENLGKVLYFEFTFRIDARVPLKPNHDLEFEGEGSIKELLFE